MPDTNNISRDHIVHGHIHNYNNIVYIHGHIHHNHTENLTTSENPSYSSTQDKRHVKIKPEHVENNQILEGSSSYKNFNKVPDTDNKTVKDNETFATFEFFNFPKGDIIQQNTVNNNLIEDNDKIIAKKRKLNSGKEIRNDNIAECTDNIVEICCDLDHNENSTTVINTDNDQTSALTAAYNGRNDRITQDNICSNNQVTSNDYSLLNVFESTNTNNVIQSNQSSRSNKYNDDLLNLNGLKNESVKNGLPDIPSNSTINVNNTMQTKRDAINIKKFLDLNCNFNCDLDNRNVSASDNKNTASEDEDILASCNLGDKINDDDDFYDRYCQLCEIHEKHSEHIYDNDIVMKNKLVQNGDKNDSDQHIKTKNDNFNTKKIVGNLNDDWNIMNDLCKISSLYETPFAKHMNHHNHHHSDQHNNQDITIHSHPHTHAVESNDDDLVNNSSSNNGVNLLGPYIRTTLTNDIGSSQNTTSHDNNSKFYTHIHAHSHGQLDDLHNHHHQHHHHQIKFHSHPIESVLTGTTNKHIEGKSKILDTTQNKSDDNDLDTNRIDISKVTLENPLKPLNTIDFDWIYQRNDNDTFRCKWKGCQYHNKNNNTPFDNLIELQRHLYENHITNDNNFNCYWSDCKFIGNDICSLVNHINEEHGIKFNIEFYASPKVQCRWSSCGLKFNTRQELNYHIENDHIIKGQKTYICKWESCNKSFNQRQKMFRHLKVHSGYKPFKCDQCHKSFTNDETLKQHLRTHSGEKPYVCDVCDKRFSTSSSLKVHKRIHTGEKPLECPICKKRFTESSNYNKHLKTHNKEFQCNICFKQFSKKKGLERHQMKVHNISANNISNINDTQLYSVVTNNQESILNDT